nr:putative ribonuclease H-like domain-containing protein [Tanacetum cinerariifolium]
RTPLSTTIDQDAPYPHISPSFSALQSHSLPPGVVAEPYFMEDHTVAPVDINPFVNVFAPEPHSEASSSGDISSTESPYVSQTLHHLNKRSKDHPLDNVIGNPSRPVSTWKQLATDALWCLNSSVLSKIKPKNFNSAIIKDCWFQAMQDEIHEFDRLQVRELVPQPDCVMIIALKWIYKVKLDEYGDVLKNKARQSFDHHWSPMEAHRSDSPLRDTVPLNQVHCTTSGCSKHMMGDRSRLLNFIKKFTGTVRFGNDHFGAIMGYGDYVVGESVISRDHLCFTCQLGKSKKHTHKPKAENTNLEVLNTLHMDLCGPIRVQTINGKKYILVIMDDYSQFTWVKFLRSKDETPEVVIKFITQIQVGLNKTVRYVRTDNGTEFVNHTMTEYYERISIFHQKSVPRTPQQNDVVERRNRTLVEAARTMLIFSKALMFLWAEAVATACYTQNRSLICTRHHKTPYELVHNKKLDLTFFRVFGALFYPTNDSKDLGKLQPTADTGIFVDYAPSRKGKSKKHTHKPKAENTNLKVLNTLHMDLCGPMRVQTIKGKKYILVIMDDYSQFTWVKFLRSKDETPEVVIKFITQIQVGLNKTVRYVRTDNGTKFVNHTMTEYYERISIFHQMSVPRTPQQNDVVERRNCTLVKAARTMLIFFKAPMFLWAEAVATACYTQNRSLIRTRHHKTPYELVHNKKLDLTFFRVFGALFYPTNDSEDLGKLQPIADTRILLVMLQAGKEPPWAEQPDSPAQAVHVLVSSAGTPLSTTIDQDAHSLHISPSSSAVQSHSLPPGVVAEPHFMDEHTVAPVDTNPFVNVFASEPHSKALSSGDISSTESLCFNSLVHSLRALSALRRSGLSTASTAAKPCQGDSSEFYLITSRIPTVVAAGQKDVNSQLHAHSSNLSSMNSKKTYNTASATLMYAAMIQDRVTTSLPSWSNSLPVGDHLRRNLASLFLLRLLLDAEGTLSCFVFLLGCGLLVLVMSTPVEDKPFKSEFTSFLVKTGGCETVINFVLLLALTVLGTFFSSLEVLSGLIVNIPGAITLSLFQF